MTILAAFLLFPILWNLYVALHKVSFINILGEWPYVGVSNFLNLLSDPFFHSSISLSAIFVGGSVSGQLLLGLTLALLLAQRLRGSGVFRLILIMPWIISSVIAGISWKWIFHDSFGLLNYLLPFVGLGPQGWLSDSNLAIWSLVMVNIWYGGSFTMLFQGAALASISPELYEAAVVDGASRWRNLRHITLPLLMPFIVINLILITMWSMNFFDLQLVMTGGGPLFATTTASLYMYRQAFEFGLISIGASVGFMLFLMNTAAAYAYVRMMRAGGGP